MGVKRDMVYFPGINILRIPEYFKQTLSEALTHKVLKLYNVLLGKTNSISLDLGLTLNPQETD